MPGMLLQQAVRRPAAARRCPWCSRGDRHRGRGSRRERRTPAAARCALRSPHADRSDDASRSKATLTGIGPNGGDVSVAADGHVLAIGARLEDAVDGVEEIIAVQRNVEADEVGAQQARRASLACQGQMPKASGLGQGMCQKMATRASGRAALTMPRQQGEVIVLHKDDGARRCLPSRRSKRVGELAVDALVALPVGGAEDGARVRDVAERPQAFVGEAVVVADFLFGVTARRGAGCSADRRAERAGGRTRPPWSRLRCRCRWATQTPSQAAARAQWRSPGRWAERRTRSPCPGARACRVRGWRRRRCGSSPACSRTWTASRSAVQRFSPASRRRASAAAAARASIRLSVMVSTSRASGVKRLRSSGLRSRVVVRDGPCASGAGARPGA